MSFLSAEINIFCEISNTNASNETYIVKVQSKSVKDNLSYIIVLILFLCLADNDEMQTIESSYVVHLYKKSSNESILNVDLYANKTFLFETLQCYKQYINSTYDVKLGERQVKTSSLPSAALDDKLSTITNNQNETKPTGEMNMINSSIVNNVSATTTAIFTSTSNSTTDTTTSRMLKTGKSLLISSKKNSNSCLLLWLAVPPSTHSAQYGMGFGITLISLLYIGEIVYFKFFYRFNHGNDEYTV